MRHLFLVVLSAVFACQSAVAFDFSIGGSVDSSLTIVGETFTSGVVIHVCDPNFMNLGINNSCASDNFLSIVVTDVTAPFLEILSYVPPPPVVAAVVSGEVAVTSVATSPLFNTSNYTTSCPYAAFRLVIRNCSFPSGNLTFLGTLCNMLGLVTSEARDSNTSGIVLWDVALVNASLIVSNGTLGFVAARGNATLLQASSIIFDHVVVGAMRPPTWLSAALTAGGAMRSNTSTVSVALLTPVFLALSGSQFGFIRSDVASGILIVPTGNVSAFDIAPSSAPTASLTPLRWWLVGSSFYVGDSVIRAANTTYAIAFNASFTTSSSIFLSQKSSITVSASVADGGGIALLFEGCYRSVLWLANVSLFIVAGTSVTVPGPTTVYAYYITFLNAFHSMYVVEHGSEVTLLASNLSAPGVGALWSFAGTTNVSMVVRNRSGILFSLVRSEGQAAGFACFGYNSENTSFSVTGNSSFVIQQSYFYGSSGFGVGFSWKGALYPSIAFDGGSAWTIQKSNLTGFLHGIVMSMIDTTSASFLLGTASVLLCYDGSTVSSSSGSAWLWDFTHSTGALISLHGPSAIVLVDSAVFLSTTSNAFAFSLQSTNGSVLSMDHGSGILMTKVYMRTSGSRSVVHVDWALATNGTMSLSRSAFMFFSASSLLAQGSGGAVLLQYTSSTNCTLALSGASAIELGPALAALSQQDCVLVVDFSQSQRGTVSVVNESRIQLRGAGTTVFGQLGGAVVSFSLSRSGSMTVASGSRVGLTEGATVGSASYGAYVLGFAAADFQCTLSNNSLFGFDQGALAVNCVSGGVMLYASNCSRCTFLVSQNSTYGFASDAQCNGSNVGVTMNALFMNSTVVSVTNGSVFGARDLTGLPGNGKSAIAVSLAVLYVDYSGSVNCSVVVSSASVFGLSNVRSASCSSTSSTYPCFYVKAQLSTALSVEVRDAGSALGIVNGSRMVASYAGWYMTLSQAHNSSVRVANGAVLGVSDHSSVVSVQLYAVALLFIASLHAQVSVVDGGGVGVAKSSDAASANAYACVVYVDGCPSINWTVDGRGSFVGAVGGSRLDGVEVLIYFYAPSATNLLITISNGAVVGCADNATVSYATALVGAVVFGVDSCSHCTIQVSHGSFLGLRDSATATRTITTLLKFSAARASNTTITVSDGSFVGVSAVNFSFAQTYWILLDLSSTVNVNLTVARGSIVGVRNCSGVLETQANAVRIFMDKSTQASLQICQGSVVGMVWQSRVLLTSGSGVAVFANNANSLTIHLWDNATIGLLNASVVCVSNDAIAVAVLPQYATNATVMVEGLSCIGATQFSTVATTLSNAYGVVLGMAFTVNPVVYFSNQSLFGASSGSVISPSTPFTCVSLIGSSSANLTVLLQGNSCMGACGAGSQLLSFSTAVQVGVFQANFSTIRIEDGSTIGATGVGAVLSTGLSTTVAIWVQFDDASSVLFLVQGGSVVGAQANANMRTADTGVQVSVTASVNVSVTFANASVLGCTGGASCVFSAIATVARTRSFISLVVIDAAFVRAVISDHSTIGGAGNSSLQVSGNAREVGILVNMTRCNRSSCVLLVTSNSVVGVQGSGTQLTSSTFVRGVWITLPGSTGAQLIVQRASAVGTRGGATISCSAVSSVRIDFVGTQDVTVFVDDNSAIGATGNGSQVSTFVETAVEIDASRSNASLLVVTNSSGVGFGNNSTELCATSVVLTAAASTSFSLIVDDNSFIGSKMSRLAPGSAGGASVKMYFTNTTDASVAIIGSGCVVGAYELYWQAGVVGSLTAGAQFYAAGSSWLRLYVLGGASVGLFRRHDGQATPNVMLGGVVLLDFSSANRAAVVIDGAGTLVGITCPLNLGLAAYAFGFTVSLARSTSATVTLSNGAFAGVADGGSLAVDASVLRTSPLFRVDISSSTNATLRCDTGSGLGLRNGATVTLTTALVPLSSAAMLVDMRAAVGALLELRDASWIGVVNQSSVTTQARNGTLAGRGTETIASIAFDLRNCSQCSIAFRSGSELRIAVNGSSVAFVRNQSSGDIVVGTGVPAVHFALTNASGPNSSTSPVVEFDGLASAMSVSGESTVVGGIWFSADNVDNGSLSARFSPPLVKFSRGASLAVNRSVLRSVLFNADDANGSSTITTAALRASLDWSDSAGLACEANSTAAAPPAAEFRECVQLDHAEFQHVLWNGTAEASFPIRIISFPALVTKSKNNDSDSHSNSNRDDDTPSVLSVCSTVNGLLLDAHKASALSPVHVDVVVNNSRCYTSSMSNSRGTPTTTYSSSLSHDHRSASSTESYPSHEHTTSTMLTISARSSTSSLSETDSMNYVSQREVTISPALRSGVTSTAVVGSLVLPTAAFGANRIAALALLGNCDDLPEETDVLSSPVSSANAPMNLAFGPARGAEQRGAVVGNLAVWLLCVAVGFALTMAVRRYEHHSEGNRFRTIVDSAARLRLPGLYFVVVSLLVQQVTTSSVLLLSTSGTTSWGARDTLVGVVGLLMTVVIFGAMLRVLDPRAAKFRAVMRILHEHTNNSRRNGRHFSAALKRAVEWLVRDGVHWGPRNRVSDKLFVERYGFLFESCHGGRHWWSLVDLGCSVVVGVLGGFVPSSVQACKALVWLGLVISVAYLAALVVLQPFHARLDFVTAVVIAATNVAVSVCTVANAPTTVVDTVGLVGTLLAMAFVAVTLVRVLHHRFVPMAASLLQGRAKPAERCTNSAHAQPATEGHQAHKKFYPREANRSRFPLGKGFKISPQDTTEERLEALIEAICRIQRPDRSIGTSRGGSSLVRVEDEVEGSAEGKSASAVAKLRIRFV